MVLAAANTTNVIMNNMKPKANKEEIWKSAASPNSLARVDAMDVPGENPWDDLWFYANPVFIKVR